MYASVDDLRLRLGDMYAPLYTGLDGAPLEAEAEKDLSAASAEIDCNIGGRYAVPVTAEAALPLLEGWALTLAEELAWSRSGKPDPPDGVKARAARVRDQLDRISRSELTLPGATEAGGGVILAASDPPVFTRDDMAGY